MMKLFRTSLVICIAIVSLAMSGCATVALMPDKLDATAKRFSPSPGKANIYVARTGILGAGVLYTVYLDGKLVGPSAPKTYLLLEVAPGEHRLRVIQPPFIDRPDTLLTLDVQAARNYFVEVDTKLPLWGNKWISLMELKEEEGRNAVRGAKRAEPSLPYAQPVIVLLRVTSEVDGEPYEAFVGNSGIQLSLRGFETGGDVGQYGRRSLPEKAQKDGWTNFLLAPGTYYLAVESVGKMRRRFFRRNSWSEVPPLESSPLWRFDVPLNAKLVYIGTLHVPGEKETYCFCILPDAMVVRNEKKEASELAAEYFPEFGGPETTLVLRHEGPLIF